MTRPQDILAPLIQAARTPAQLERLARELETLVARLRERAQAKRNEAARPPSERVAPRKPQAGPGLLGDERWATFKASYLAADNTEPERDYEVVSWAYDHLPDVAAEIDAIEAAQVANAVAFALGYVPDEYDPEDYAARWG